VHESIIQSKQDEQVFKRMGIGDSTISNSEIRLIRWCFNIFCEKTHGKSHPMAVVAYALCLASQDEERQRPLCDTIASHMDAMGSKFHGSVPVTTNQPSWSRIAGCD